MTLLLAPSSAGEPKAPQTPPSEPAPLPPTIRQHIESVLDQTYGPLAVDVMTVGEGRFAGLLSQLQQALDRQEERDARAFHAEFLAFVPNLRRFAVSLTKDPVRADDLVQDTLLKAWRSRSRFTAGTNLGAWLFTIMRNVFYSDYRRRVREVDTGGADDSARLISVPEQPGRLDLQDMKTALGKLPAVMRQALVLVAIENLSYEEAATVMECRVGTVKSRVWRAREQLAILLGFDAGELGADHVTMSVVNGAGLAAGP